MVNTLSILNVESDEEQQAAEEFAYHLQRGEPYLKWVHSMPLGPNPSTKTAANSDDYLNGKYVPEKFEGMFEAFSDELSMIREGFGALQRFGTVDGNSFSSYGPITSKQLISEAITSGSFRARTHRLSQRNKLTRCVTRSAAKGIVL